MRIASRRAHGAWLAVAVAAGSSACSRPAGPLDLLRATPRLKEATVAGRSFTWVVGQIGKQVRINDGVRRTLPASPPSRLLYRVDLPADAQLAFDYGVSAERADKPGIQFVVKVKRGRNEETVFSQLLDPASRPHHRHWNGANIDLAKYTGRDVQLIFETQGFDDGKDPRAAFWGSPAITSAASPGPLIVLYLVDTLRADHTGPYGYPRQTTPELNAFAKDAVVFDAAIAQASWTKPSVASIFTSLLPGRHRAVQLRDPLDTSFVTLAEMLEESHYATGAAVANSVIYSQGGNFEQGFDWFTGLHGAGDKPSKIVAAAPVVDAGLRWIDARRGFPTFVYVHTMDPHVPYTPPPPFDRRFEPRPTKDHPAQDPRSDYKEPLDKDRMIAQYDGEIAYGDQEFGRFVRGLKERGLYDRALFIFVGDHGEEFMDHGKWLHGRSVFDELVRIPLIVKFPGQRDAGKRVARQVQEVDLLPTILSEQGLKVPQAPAIAGRPLQPIIKGGAPEVAALSEISHRGFVAHGLRTERDKYVQRFSPEEDELYFDLRQDPKETTNLLDRNAERVRQLRAGVEAAMTPNPFQHILRAGGAGRYEIKLRTGGWIEDVQTAGFGQADKYEVQNNGRRLWLQVAPKKDQPREVSFNVRPRGAPVWLEGTRDGKPLDAQSIFIAKQGAHPDSVPVRLPESEATTDDEKELAYDVTAAPEKEQAGIQLWLRMLPGRQRIEMSKADCEKWLALGYVSNCAGNGH